MAERAKHAFGALENVDSALASGKIDAFDILFVKDANNKPYVGWIDRDGNKVIVDDSAEFEALENELASKVSVEELAEVDAKIETKADAAEVDAKVEQAVTDSVASAKAYTDGKVEAAIAEHLTQKYEITGTPAGPLVKMNENEIRIMCPHDAEYNLQDVGTGGDSNTYYITFKTYVYDDNVVGYKEHLGSSVDAEILTDLKTDQYGRRYQPTWLGIAKYDQATDSWTYYGANSSESKMIGWYYQLDLFDANGVMIGSDSIRINLSNENCHYESKPYYVGTMMTEVEALVEERIKEIEVAYEVIEF